MSLVPIDPLVEISPREGMNLLVPQSEADTFLTCERKHYYAFGEKLMSKSLGIGLNRGSMGHSAFEIYYTVWMQTRDIAVARGAVRNFFENEITTRGVSASMDMVIPLMQLISAYLDHYENEFDEWEILAVEKEFATGNFPFKPDLIKRHKYSGQVVVVDHKFLYNFYQLKDIQLFPQLVKYAGYLNSMGLKVDSAEYNMIRHRDNAKEKFKRLPFKIPKPRTERYMYEQAVVTERINARKHLIPLETWKDIALRTANSFNCTNGRCPFVDICQADLDNAPGRDLLVSSFYTENTYGYNVTIADEDEG